VLRPMAGRVQRFDPSATEHELSPHAQTTRARTRARRVLWMWMVAPVAAASDRGRDVVGVVVGLEDVRDRDPEVGRQLEVLVDLKARIDDRRDTGLVIADQVRGQPRSA